MEPQDTRTPPSASTGGASTAGGVDTAEHARLEEARTDGVPWKRWGPYLSERQWGTVREDYSDNGDAWDYFLHDEARSRAYRWGEDGLAGISDDKQRLCFSVALWNGRDPIVKERLFGLTNSEGNHGEDVKEYYFYLDSTPTHSYMQYLYKYPQAEFPYNDLVHTNRVRSRSEMEYELLDTGVFAEDRYFDVFVDYAKGAPEDVLVRIRVCNRGPESAELHVLPTLWFRNTWSWGSDAYKPLMEEWRPAGGADPGIAVVRALHATLGERFLACEGDVPLLFTENETNTERLFGTPNGSRYVKDGINACVVDDRSEAVNPERTGTKAAAHYRLQVPAGEERVIRLRLSERAPATPGSPAQSSSPDQPTFGAAYDGLFATRQAEADDFYREITPAATDEDTALIMRQALAGMLWSKQYYNYDLVQWLAEHGADPTSPAPRLDVRNRQWFHMVNDDVISMPDTWEYPWYAAWDLAFHTLPLFMVDPDFAKEQLSLVLRESYMHPNGQLPAYEWNFGDVNPPVHAWAAYFLYWNEELLRGRGDRRFLESTFQKLMLNFTWWVNRKDSGGSNVFEGGFLGLDNIGVFDRSAPLPTGGRLEQADGTAWMAFYSLMMLQVALVLAQDDPVYEELACKFYEHFLWISSAMDRVGVRRDELWDEDDGFFYDLLCPPDGEPVRLKVRSMVGLLSLGAAAVVEPDMVQRLPVFMERVRWFHEHHPQLTQNIRSLATPGHGGRRLLSVLDETKLRRVLARLLDEEEFLSPYGIRSLSRYHRDHPYVFRVHGQEFRVAYEPAESTSGLYGGNSNWRGPVWMPVNLLLLRGLWVLYSYYGDDFTVECPTGSGRQMTLFEVSQELTRRLIAIFARDETGRRPVFGGATTFQENPHWHDRLLFYEYFHGDNGAGLGASHQTGWTGLVAKLIQLQGAATAGGVLSTGGHIAEPAP